MGTESLWEGKFVKENRVAVGTQVVVFKGTGKPAPSRYDYLNSPKIQGGQAGSVVSGEIAQETIIGAELDAPFVPPVLGIGKAVIERSFIVG